MKISEIRRLRIFDGSLTDTVWHRRIGRGSNRISIFLGNSAILTFAFFFSIYSVNVSLSMLARLVSRLVTPAGSCTALSTASSPMVRCPPIRLSVVAMTHSTPSSARPAPASMCPVPCLLTWSQLWSMRFALAHTASCSIPSS